MPLGTATPDAGTGGMIAAFAAAVVRLRVVVVVAWVVAAVVLTLTLPSLEEAQTGGLGDLVPAGAEAVATEQRAAELFAFPLASRTLVVQRDPDGLSADALARTAKAVLAVNRNALPRLRDALGAYGLTNSLPLPFARERGTVLAVAAYLRSAVAPLVALATVAVAYLVAIRLVAASGRALGVSVPSEIQPVIVALLFGVVSDYALFYMSRLRRVLATGTEPVTAARRTTAELTPIVVACGSAVALGMAALLVARLGFLRAFGPGVALTVLVGMLVALTLLPALLALLGARLLWPGRSPAAGRPRRRGDRPERLLRRIVAAPRRAVALCLVLLVPAIAAVGWLRVGNPLIRGLPAGNGVRQAYEQLTRGFAAGVAAPTGLVVEAPGIARRRPALAALQADLAAVPGVAGVIGPATSPAARPFGIVLARSGDAARFVIVLDGDPLSGASIALLDRLRATIDARLARVGLGGARAGFAGDTALVAEIVGTAKADLLRVVPAVLVVVALVLAVLLRALVAPLYLVAIATLAPLAATGLAVVLFQGLLGQQGIAYFVPIVAGVLLVALGSDYNIFLVGRIWAEARTRPLHEAVVVGGAGAARAISAAGLILAGSFAALALTDVRAFVQLAFVLAAGLLIDAFLVRTLLTPAVIALVGERSAWPGRGPRVAPGTAGAGRWSPSNTSGVRCTLADVMVNVFGRRASDGYAGRPLAEATEGS